MRTAIVTARMPENGHPVGDNMRAETFLDTPPFICRNATTLKP